MHENTEQRENKEVSRWMSHTKAEIAQDVILLFPDTSTFTTYQAGCSSLCPGVNVIKLFLSGMYTFSY
jgi:hypothetical protein